jgi:hypothetical protein
MSFFNKNKETDIITLIVKMLQLAPAYHLLLYILRPLVCYKFS